MNEQLKLLIELQALDSVILSTRIKIDTIPSSISSQEGPLRSAEAAYENAKQKQSALEKKKKDRERDIEDINEKIKKLKSRTSEVKTNKEYQAQLKEIETAEKDLRIAEDEILSIMESMEESSKLLKVENGRISEERAKIGEIKKELEKKASIFEQEVKKLKKSRKLIVGRIESDIYNQYVIILKAHRGIAVVEARDEICLGCNIHIPPQMFVELKKNEEIVHCPQCRRILYYVVPEGGREQQEAGPQKTSAARESD